jgi:SPX domain protein involved in polyphosphate accumulation
MSFRIEKKLYIKNENLLNFRKFIKSKNFENQYDDRKVKSIYFDNNSLELYKDSTEGSNPRKKIRIRNYPEQNSDYLFEIKISSVEGRYKISKKISDKYCSQLLLNGIKDNNYGFCKPIIEVIYNREYYKKKDIRVTIDTNIYYKLYKKNFSKKEFQVVVEIKTNYENDIDEIFKEIPLQEIRFSKYCNGIEKFKMI